MDSLFCKYCQKQKLCSEFNKSSYNKRGYQYRCRLCERHYQVENSAHIRIRKKTYRHNNKEKLSLQKKEYRNKNREKIAIIGKKWRLRTADARKAYKRKYYQEHKEHICNYAREYAKNHPEWKLKYHREYAKNKRATDPNYAIAHRLRTRTIDAIKKDLGSKTLHFQELVGCDIETLRNHIYQQFTEGMTWEKFLAAEIEIDHIIPCCGYDLTDVEQQKQCFNYKNLRPLWKADNKRKIKDDLKKRLI